MKFIKTFNSKAITAKFSVGQKDLTSILASFTEVKQELVEFCKSSSKEISDNKDKIKELEKDNAFLAADRAKALAAVSKINKLLGE